jgi:hypothetical protein
MQSSESMVIANNHKEFYFSGNYNTFSWQTKRAVCPFRFSVFPESGKIFRKNEEAQQANDMK